MKAQSGIEYLIIMGFVTLAITFILLSAYFYINMSRNRIRENQIENMAMKIVSSAESVFYAGEPSKVTIIVYMPSGVNKIELAGYDLIITFSTSSGATKRAFTSRVYLEGTISEIEGSKKLTVEARADRILISPQT